MGFKGFALEAGQKHKSESYVFSFISCNYQSLKEGFIVAWLRKQTQWVVFLSNCVL